MQPKFIFSFIFLGLRFLTVTCCSIDVGNLCESGTHLTLDSMYGIRDNQVGSVSIGDTYYLSLDLELHSGHYGPWLNIFHVGSVDTERSPALFLRGNINQIHMIMSDEAWWNRNYDLMPTLSLNTVYNIKLIASGGNVTSYLDDVPQVSRSGINITPRTNAPVYVSDPFYNPAHATITNLVIQPCDCTTHTGNPTSIPSGSPTSSPTYAPTTLSPTLLPIVAPPRNNSKCHEAESCMYQNFVQLDQNIECYGYKSCSRAICSDTSALLECSGALSCYKASGLINDGPDAALVCHGLLSCAESTIETASKWLFCEGERSCAGAVVTFAASVDCGGYLACESAIINTNTIQLVAAYAARGAVVTQASSSIPLSVQVTSHRAAQDAVFICGVSSSCSVQCWWLPLACDNLILQCVDDVNNVAGSGSCTWTVTDTSGAQPTVEAAFKEPNLDFLDVSNALDQLSLCESSAALVADYSNYSDNAGSDPTLRFGKKLGLLCCAASYGCSSNHGSVMNDILRLDGLRSGSSVDVTEAPLAVSALSAFFSGSFSGEFTDVYGCGQQSGFVAATGSLSMTSGYLARLGNVYCLGDSSCTGKTFESVFGDIFILAKNIMVQKIDQVDGGIYVAGMVSGAFTISNVAGDIVGLGFQALASGDIQNVAGKLSVNGRFALAMATISNVSRVEIHGDTALWNSEITSNVGDGNSFLLDMNASGSPQFDLICTENNICNVNCLGSDSCAQAIMDCRSGPCFVYCGVNGIACPDPANVQGTLTVVHTLLT